MDRVWYRYGSGIALRVGIAQLTHRTLGFVKVLACGCSECRLGAQMYVPAAVRKCSIARLLEVADMYPAFGSAFVFCRGPVGSTPAPLSHYCPDL